MMRFRLLGPLEVRAGEDWREIGPPKAFGPGGAADRPRADLPADTLIGEVWRDAPLARVANLISIYVLRPRRLLDDADSPRLVTRAPGLPAPG